MADYSGEGFAPADLFGESISTPLDYEGFRACRPFIPPPLSPVDPAVIIEGAVFQGPLEGGVQVSFFGGGDTAGAFTYEDTYCDDDFTGGVLDASKWTSAVAGSGTVTQNDALFLRTGTSVSSSAEVSSVPVFGTVFDLQVDFSILTDVINAPPLSLVRFFELELYVDASNYIRISRLYDPDLDGGHAFRVTALNGGTTVDNLTIPNHTRTSVLRVLRVKNRVIVKLGSTTLYDDVPFSATEDAQVILRAVNPSGVNAYDVQTSVDNFAVGMVVLWGTEPGIVRTTAETSVRAESPAVYTPRFVPVEVYNCNGLLFRIGTEFEYYLATQFQIFSERGVSLGILSDTTLRNLPNGRAGFGA